jgi:hypothetical protein
MTTKQQLILLGLLLLCSTLVIGEYRIWYFTMPVFWICLPVFIYSLLRKTRKQIIVVLISLMLGGYGLFAIFSIFRFVMCGYRSPNDWYVSRTNENVKIVGSDFSCFGTTGDLVLYKQYSVTKNIKFEIYYRTFLDYKNIDIDKSAWKPVN